MEDNLKIWYDFVLQQMAAESYLDDLDVDDLAEVKKNLIAGSTHAGDDPDEGSTHMTAQQADYFLKNFEIVAHHKNDASGFSGTLFRNKTSGEYTLSMRSTESREQADGGDWERDGLDGSDGQIGGYGYAFCADRSYGSLLSKIQARQRRFR